MSRAYTSNGKRRSSQTHAKRVRTCTCGKVCRGNGGWSSHRRVCAWGKAAKRSIDFAGFYGHEQ